MHSLGANSFVIYNRKTSFLRGFFIKLYLIFFILIFTTLSLHAENTYPEDSISNLPREKNSAIKNNWEIVSGLKTISEKKFKGKNSEVHHRKGGDVFVNKVKDASKPILQVEDEDEAQVVYNPKRKMTGFIPGTIIVNYTSRDELMKLLNDYPVKLVRLEEDSLLAIIKVKKGFDMSLVTLKLQSDARVKSAQLEITFKGLKAK